MISRKNQGPDSTSKQKSRPSTESTTCVASAPLYHEIKDFDSWTVLEESHPESMAAVLGIWELEALLQPGRATAGSFQLIVQESHRLEAATQPLEVIVAVSLALTTVRVIWNPQTPIERRRAVMRLRRVAPPPSCMGGV